MAETFRNRLVHAWNAFRGQETKNTVYGPPVSYRSENRPRFTRGNEQSIVTSVLNRISMDVAALTFNHVRQDSNGRFKEVMKTSLNDCLTISANIDQTGRAFIQDAVMSMLDEGVVVLVPVDTNIDPEHGSFSIESIRTGRVVDWYADAVRVSVYNEKLGRRQDITCPKSTAAIVENPFYAVMNEPSSTFKRLTKKLALLDFADAANNSNKLDLIIQLPYVIKTEARRKEANKRRQEIISQLQDSDYGIAYTDGTERITQLNRSVENNLLKQIEYLTNQFYAQMGLSQAILDGTADEATMLNYNNRVIEPIASALTDAMTRVFLTKTARTQGQAIDFFTDPFRLVPVTQMAEIADKFVRNEVATKNEIRQVMGWKPSEDPMADKLLNPNISQPDTLLTEITGNKSNGNSTDQNTSTNSEEEVNQNGEV